MTFALRNTIALVVLLVLILIAGFYQTGYRQPKRLEKIGQQISEVDRELLNTPDLLSHYAAVREELEYWNARWNRRTKDIPKQDVTGVTNAHLNSVMLASGLINVDVQFTATKQEPKYGSNSYTLRGEAPFSSVYRFILSLERGHRLFKIPRLALKGIMSKELGDENAIPAVQFDLDMRAYFTAAEELTNGMTPSDPAIADAGYNPFWPLIRTDVPRNIENLVDVDRSELKAVIPGKAFLTDQAGKLWSLSLGDKVYLGYLSNISPEESKAEFMLNKGGITETVTLKVRFRQTSSDVKR